MTNKSRTRTRLAHLLRRARKAGFSTKREQLCTGSRLITLNRYDNSFTWAKIMLTVRPLGRFSVAARTHDHFKRNKRGVGEAVLTLGTFEMIDRWALEKAEKAKADQDAAQARRKLYDMKSGLWYRIGAGFEEPCFCKASVLGPQEASGVRVTFGNVGQHLVGALMAGELPECNCGNCDI